MRNVRLSSFVCESKIRRQTGVSRFLLWFTDASIKNWCWKILIRITEAYIKNMFIKLIFKTFTLDNKRKQVRILAHLVKTVFSVRYKSDRWSNG
jgi:hypothetical protein